MRWDLRVSGVLAQGPDKEIDIFSTWSASIFALYPAFSHALSTEQQNLDRGRSESSGQMMEQSSISYKKDCCVLANLVESDLVVDP